MVTRRQGRRSNPHQPLTSDDIYPHDHKWKYCSHFYTSCDDDWSIQLKCPDKSFVIQIRELNFLSILQEPTETKVSHFKLQIREPNFPFQFCRSQLHEKPLKIITFHCVSSVIILFWWSISLQFVYGKTSKQPYKL